MKVGTLFSGLGAPELAIEKLGIKYSIEFACDNDKSVKETYLANHKCKIFYDDITKIKKVPKVDLLIFGFPCQPFSLAGNGNGLEDERGKLVFKAINLIKNNKPKAFIAENVEGIVRRDNGSVLKYLLNRFQKIGYKVKYSVLNSLDFGVPQNRKRVWIVGLLKGDYNFPDTKSLFYPSLLSLLDKKVDRKFYATKDFLLKLKVAARISNYDKPYINCITQTIARNGSSSEYISYVSAVNKAIGQKRKPTPKECCRLFGFPESFTFPDDICITKRYSMIANSMVVPQIKEIIERIL